MLRHIFRCLNNARLAAGIIFSKHFWQQSVFRKYRKTYREAKALYLEIGIYAELHDDTWVIALDNVPSYTDSNTTHVITHPKKEDSLDSLASGIKRALFTELNNPTRGIILLIPFDVYIFLLKNSSFVELMHEVYFKCTGNVTTSFTFFNKSLERAKKACLTYLAKQD